MTINTHAADEKIYDMVEKGAEAAHKVAEHGAGHGQFYEDPTFWVGVSFFLVVACVYKPVSRGLKALLGVRAEKVQNRILEARKLREDTQELLVEYEKKQRTMEDEVLAIQVEAKRQAEHTRSTFIEELNETVARRQQLANETIALAEHQATEEVRNKSIDLTLAATAVVLKNAMKAADVNKLADDAISRVSGELSSI